MEDKDTSLSTNFAAYAQDDASAKAFYARAEDNMAEGALRSRDRSLTHDKYYETRPDEKVPVYGRYQQSQHIIIDACNQAYKTNPLIRSVIDLMAEWAVDGVKVVSVDGKNQDVFDAWETRIKLHDVSEQFCRWLAKSGNVVVRRKWGTARRRKIPVGYAFYDPSSVELIGDFLGTVADQRIYALKVPIHNLVNRTTSRNDLEQKVFNSLPLEIKNAMNGVTVGSTYYQPIPEKELHVDYYKKDDSEVWATPFVYTILPDVFYNKKLHLAKTTLLDGMMNPIRIWALGDIVNGAIPSPALGKALENIIVNHVGGGAIDIVWDDLIKLQVEYPPIEKIKDLVDNDEKILYGLGIQVFGKEVIKESAPIAIKDMVKRVAYLRSKLLYWLNLEIAYLCDGLGMDKASRPHVQFKYPDFDADQTYMKFMLELLDRNVISDERMLRVINESPIIEKARLQKESDMREQEKMPQKTSPFHNPAQAMMDKFKLVELKQSEEANYNNDSKKKFGDSKPGRPTGAKDSVKRQRTKGDLTVQASVLLDKVSDLVQPKYLESIGKTDLRTLTGEEKEKLFQIKAFAFASIDPDAIDDLTEDVIEASISKADMLKINNFWLLYEQMVKGVGIKLTNASKNSSLVSAFVNNYYEDIS
jgi:hypothetical protein